MEGHRPLHCLGCNKDCANCQCTKKVVCSASGCGKQLCKVNKEKTACLIEGHYNYSKGKLCVPCYELLQQSQQKTKTSYP